MSAPVHDAARWFLRAVAGTLAAGNGGEEGVETALARLAAQDVSAARFAPVEPRRLPACRYLPDVVAASLLVAPDVAAALAALEEDLAWQHNPGYAGAAMGDPHFLDNYAYAEIVGPGGFYPGDDFLLGLLLIGPERHYRDHRHPAPELYWLLAGTSEWRRGGEDWSEREAGDTVWHDPGVVHATRTGRTPLLALYMWTRDVAEPARLV